MRKKRELTKARLIKDLNITSTIIFGILFMLAGISGITLLIWRWQSYFEKVRMALPIIGMFMFAFAAIGVFMLYCALKDRHDINKNNFSIFTDAVLRIEPIQTRPSNRVYFEEYTRHCGFGAVEMSMPKVKVGDEYLLVKLPSSNFVALAYPCSAFALHKDLKDTVKQPQIALSK